MSSPQPQSIFPPLPELRSTTAFGQTIRYYDVGLGPPLLLNSRHWRRC